MLETLGALDLAGVTDVLVASDHGFTMNTAGVDVVGELVAAGLKASRDSNDVVLASSGQAVGLHVNGRDRERVAALARFVQSRDAQGTSWFLPEDAAAAGAVGNAMSLAVVACRALRVATSGAT